MGGLSSSYYHRELIGYDQVDYVLRGDSTEPPLHQLLMALRKGEPVDRIPNLTWKDAAGVHVNPLSFVPMSLDYVDLRPELMIEMVLRYRDLASILPYKGWWNHPITTVFTVKGCAFECVTCGSSPDHLQAPDAPAEAVYRSPASLVANMQDFSRLSSGPIFLVGDLLMAGPAHAAEVLERLAEGRTCRMRSGSSSSHCRRSRSCGTSTARSGAGAWSSAPRATTRRCAMPQEGEAGYTTQEMEALIQEALRLRCAHVDIFFLIGLPAQTAASVRETIEYCGHLFEQSDGACVLLHLTDGPLPRSGQPRLRGARTLRLPLVRTHSGGTSQAPGAAQLGTHSELRDEVDDAPASWSMPPTMRPRGLNELKVQHGRISRRRGRGVARGHRRRTGPCAGGSTQGWRRATARPWMRCSPEKSPASACRPCATSASCTGQSARFNFRIAEVLRIVGRYARGLLRP